ncbi:MAG: proton-conducting transporter membrane subunit, partial [Alphaproteobacteria bacterium]
MIGTLPAVVLVGILAAVAIAAARPRFAAPIAATAAAAAFCMVASGIPLTAAGGFIVSQFWSAPSLGVVGGLKLDGLALVFALLISGIGALVFLYAGQYMKGDPKLRRLMIILAIFMTAMLGAVLADDVILLFVFWEITSVASFLLVGLDSANPNARKSALKALLVTGGGGLALLAGLVLVSIAAGTTSLTGVILAREAVLAHPAAMPAMLLIVVGCF